MIISASYRTDIPAFYGEWFLNRLKAGYCRIVNPYNRKVSTVDLSRSAVDGIVFWTRNPLPFMDGLSSVMEMGYPFYLQYTITGYPGMIEPHVPSLEDSVSLFDKISCRYGPHSVVWRYDPILFSSLWGRDFHISNFSRLAGLLEGLTTEVVISFTQFYRKILLRMNRVESAEDIRFRDPPPDEKKSLAGILAEIASSRGMTLSLCGQRELLSEGVADASCVDPFRLSRVAGKPIPIPAKRPHRPGAGCGCYAARDVGEYETCLHDCLYCYAVRDRAKALDNFSSHDPVGEFLLPPGSREFQGKKPGERTQGFLFDQ